MPDCLDKANVVRLELCSLAKLMIQVSPVCVSAGSALDVESVAIRLRSSQNCSRGIDRLSYI